MDSFLELLKQSGGFFEGHTVFKNGFHGNGWIEKGFIIRKPRVLDMVTRYQAEIVARNFPESELIVGPIVNGSIIASFVAKHLDKEFAITVGNDAGVEFHRMYVPKPPKKVVLIEDLIFTGHDIAANVRFLKEKGFGVEGVVVWINRQEDNIDGVKIISLLDKPPFEFYEAKDCPLCLSNTPVKYSDIRE